jgi:RimJ/RimL family protein N-acetyltransferase
VASPWGSIAFPIRTERLLLRQFQTDDVSGLHDISSRPDVARFVPWEPRDEATVRRVIAERVGGELQGLSLAVISTEQDTEGVLVGEVSLFGIIPDQRTAEVGFVFHPDHTGRGLATEAVGAVLDIAFGEMELHRVVGRSDARNLPSIRLMERLGMRREAHLVENEYLKGEWTDEVDFAILAREWDDARARGRG